MKKFIRRVVFDVQEFIVFTAAVIDCGFAAVLDFEFPEVKFGTDRGNELLVSGELPLHNLDRATAFLDLEFGENKPHVFMDRNEKMIQRERPAKSSDRFFFGRCLVLIDAFVAYFGCGGFIYLALFNGSRILFLDVSRSGLFISHYFNASLDVFSKVDFGIPEKEQLSLEAINRILLRDLAFRILDDLFSLLDIHRVSDVFDRELCFSVVPKSVLEDEGNLKPEVADHAGLLEHAQLARPRGFFLGIVFDAVDHDLLRPVFRLHLRPIVLSLPDTTDPAR